MRRRLARAGRPAAGAWRLRAAGGFTGRANSALAVGDPGMPVPARARRGAPRSPPSTASRPGVQAPVGSPWDRAVAPQGWVLDAGHEAGRSRWWRRLDAARRRRARPGPSRRPPSRRPAVVGRLGEAGDDPARRACRRPGRPRPSAFGDGPRGRRRPDRCGPGGRRRRPRAPVAAGGRSPRHDGRASAPRSRRGRRGMGRANGRARYAVLQVAARNAEARALYERLGCVEHHRYRYLVPGTSVAASPRRGSASDARLAAALFSPDHSPRYLPTRRRPAASRSTRGRSGRAGACPARPPRRTAPGPAATPRRPDPAQRRARPAARAVQVAGQLGRLRVRGRVAPPASSVTAGARAGTAPRRAAPPACPRRATPCSPATATSSIPWPAAPTRPTPAAAWPALRRARDRGDQRGEPADPAHPPVLALGDGPSTPTPTCPAPGSTRARRGPCPRARARRRSRSVVGPACGPARRRRERSPNGSVSRSPARIGRVARTNGRRTATTASSGIGPSPGVRPAERVSVTRSCPPCRCAISGVRRAHRALLGASGPRRRSAPRPAGSRTDRPAPVASSNSVCHAGTSSESPPGPERAEHRRRDEPHHRHQRRAPRLAASASTVARTSHGMVSTMTSVPIGSGTGPA